MMVKQSILVIIISLILTSNLVFGQTVRMTIEGIRNNKGSIHLGIFTSQEQFSQENPSLEKFFVKTALKGGVLKLEFELKPGNYAIAVLDDENNSGDMNYNLIGMPLEGFGFSNYISSGLRKPKYSEFSFFVKSGINNVNVKMRYIL